VQDPRGADSGGAGGSRDWARLVDVATAVRVVVRAVRRRWLVVVLAAAAGLVVAGWPTGGSPSGFVAEALCVVPGGGGKGVPGSQSEAVLLTRTYAAVVPEDIAIGRQVRAAVGSAGARGTIEAEATEGTSVLALRYRHPDPVVAVRGARALARAVTEPVSPSVPGGSLVLSSLPTEAERTTTPPAPLPLVLAAALVIGVLAAVALDLVDPHLDDAAAATATTSLPFSAVGRLRPPALAVLVRRWVALVGRRPVRIVLVPVDVPSTLPLARRLAEAAALEGVIAFVLAPDSDPRVGHTADVLLHAANPIGDGEATESLAAAADLVVVVARRGAPARPVLDRIDLLRQIDAAPGWGLLVEPPPSGRPVATPEPAAPASASPVGIDADVPG
jgi:hypothetical protein